MTILTTGTKTEAWETDRTWPTVNRVFNVSAFAEPETRYSTDSESVNQRAKGYAHLLEGFASRGKPQLTYFDATYDVPAHEGSAPEFCKYPNLVGRMTNGKRLCLKPGALTEAELLALKKEQERDQAAIAAYLTAAAKIHPCDAPVAVYKNGVLVPGQTTKATSYKQIDANGRSQVYSCPAPGKFLYTEQTVRGLGESELEKKEIASLRSAYRSTELALIGALVVGFFLVWRN